MGELVPEKGPDTFAESIKLLRREASDLPDFEAVAMGGNTWSVGQSKRDSMGSALRQAHIELLSPRYGDDYVRFLQSCDVIVTPAGWDDPFPLVNLQAMAVGLPVVTCDRGGIPEAVTDLVTGFVVESGNARAIAVRLRTLLEQEQLRTSMGAAGRQAVVKSFSWPTHLDRLAELHGELADGAVRRHGHQ